MFCLSGSVGARDRAALTLWVCLSVIALSACGQKGALLLPKSATPPPASPPASAGEATDPSALKK